MSHTASIVSTDHFRTYGLKSSPPQLLPPPNTRDSERATTMRLEDGLSWLLNRKRPKCDSGDVWRRSADDVARNTARSYDFRGGVVESGQAHCSASFVGCIHSQPKPSATP